MTGAAPIPALTVPRTLFAPGAIGALRAELDALGVRRPLLVTDHGVAGAGLAQGIIDAWGDSASIVMFDGVTENPLFADVNTGARHFATHDRDGVIALGGGSVIDTAKFIALLATNAGTIADYIGKPRVPHVAGAPLVAIPTTAGTGSEASPSAGIHPDAGSASLGLSSRHLVPAVAILDPELTASLPTRLVAATGIDALSHCIEGYLSKKQQPLGKSIALDGIARVSRWLRRAVNDRGDATARGEMMLAAYAGGISIGMGLGPAHAVALTCSDQGFHHGVLSGIGLIATLDATSAIAPDRVAEAGAAFGLAPGESLAGAVSSLMGELGLPTSLAALRYAATDAGALGDAAHRSHFNLSAPCHPSAAHYASMIAASLAAR